MSNDKINIRAGNISGGLAIGDRAQAVGAGGSLVNDASGLEQLLPLLRAHLTEVPEDKRTEAETIIEEVEKESRTIKPDGGKIDTLLKSLRAIAEGTITRLITSFLVGS